MRSFGAFWYDFLVGDRPELFVGSILVLAGVAVAVRAGLDPTLAAPLLAVLILGLAGLSLELATRRAIRRR